jgi:hypothetical protein
MEGEVARAPRCSFGRRGKAQAREDQGDPQAKRGRQPVPPLGRGGSALQVLHAAF